MSAGLIGWVGTPEALVALVSSDQDDGIQACSGKPNHLAYAMNLLHRRLPGGHQRPPRCVAHVPR